MDNIENYLDQFEDFELAFFYKYKLNTYLEETQSRIKAFLKRRNLDETKMERLIAEYSHRSFSDNELRCPRCTSKKLITRHQALFDPSNCNYNLIMELMS